MKITLPFNYELSFGFDKDKLYNSKYYLIYNYIFVLCGISYICIFGLNIVSLVISGMLLNIALAFNDVCVLPKTLILTSKGLKYIEDIEVGDLVLSHKNRWQKVLKLYKTHVNKEIHIVNNYLNITGNHRLMTTDYTRTGGRFKLDNFKSNWESVDDLVLQDLSKKGVMGLKNSEYTVDCISIKLEERPLADKHSKELLNKELKLTKEFLNTVGLFLGDGHITKNTNQLGITLGTTKKNKEAGSLLEEFSNQANFKWTITKKPKGINAYGFLIIRKQLSDIFNVFYNINREKDLPLEWLNLPLSKFKHIVYGLFLADGNNIYNKGKLYGFEISNTSFPLLNKIKIRLESEGVFTKLMLRRGAGKYKVMGKLCDCKDYYSLQFRSEGCSKIFKYNDKNWYKSKRPQGYKEIFDYIVKPFKIYDNHNYIGDVYNLEVENDNSYIANGVIVHNCNDKQMCILEKENNLFGKLQAIQWSSLAVMGLFVSIFGAWLASNLPEPLNYKVAYGITGVLPILIILYLTKFYDEKPISLAKKPRTFKKDLKFFKDKSFIMGLLFIAFMNFSPSFGTALMIQMREVLHIDKMFLGYLSATGTVLGLVGYILYYFKAHKYPIKNLLYFTIIFGALTNLFYLHLPNKWVILSYSVLFGAFSGISFLAILAYIARIVPKGAEGLFYAFVVSINNFSAQLGDVFGGYIYDNLGYTWNVLISTGFTLCCLFFIPHLGVEDE